MKAIATVDRRLGIGKNGYRLVTIPMQRQMILEAVRGKAVILGRKTLEALPQGQPLPYCRNIVLSRKASGIRGAEIVRSVDEAIDFLKRERIPSKDVFVLGGESVFREFMPWTDTLLLTEIDYIYDSDAHFPKFDPEEWQLAEQSGEETYFDLVYVFSLYRKKTPARDL